MPVCVTCSNDFALNLCSRLLCTCWTITVAQRLRCFVWLFSNFSSLAFFVFTWNWDLYWVLIGCKEKLHVFVQVVFDLHLDNKRKTNTNLENEFRSKFVSMALTEKQQKKKRERDWRNWGRRKSWRRLLTHSQSMARHNHHFFNRRHRRHNRHNRHRRYFCRNSRHRLTQNIVQKVFMQFKNKYFWPGPNSGPN